MARHRRRSYSRRTPSSGLTFVQLAIMGFILIVLLLSRGSIADVMGGGFEQLTETEDETSSNETNSDSDETEVESDDSHQIGIEFYDPSEQ